VGRPRAEGGRAARLGPPTADSGPQRTSTASFFQALAR
jgi:hypothetical protein